MHCSRLESILLLQVLAQVAPWASQFAVSGRTTATSPLESGSNVIRQRMLLELHSRCAFITAPPDTTEAIGPDNIAGVD